VLLSELVKCNSVYHVFSSTIGLVGQNQPEEWYRLFFDVHFCPPFTTCSTLYYYLWLPASLDSRHNFWKYALSSFLSTNGLETGPTPLLPITLGCTNTFIVHDRSLVSPVDGIRPSEPLELFPVFFIARPAIRPFFSRRTQVECRSKPDCRDYSLMLFYARTQRYDQLPRYLVSSWDVTLKTHPCW
jgi:hypothetical protein